LKTRGGELKSAEARYFKGHSQDPLTNAEIEGKFRALAAKKLTPAQMDGVLATAWRLEKLGDIGELLGLLGFRDEKRSSRTQKRKKQGGVRY
jgi:2-methylcitrate dehydratase PrpD